MVYSQVQPKNKIKGKTTLCYTEGIFTNAINTHILREVTPCYTDGIFTSAILEQDIREDKLCGIQ